MREVVLAAVGEREKEKREPKRSNMKKRKERGNGQPPWVREEKRKEPERGLKLQPLQPPKPKLSPSLNYHHI